MDAIVGRGGPADGTVWVSRPSVDCPHQVESLVGGEGLPEALRGGVLRGEGTLLRWLGIPLILGRASPSEERLPESLL